MTRFEIIGRDGIDYVVDHINKFVLKVIPAENVPDDGYPLGSPVVEARLYQPGILKNPFASADEVYFYGLDINYYDSDSRGCNKDLWKEAISFYSQLHFNTTNLDIYPLNYDFDIIEPADMNEFKEWISLGADEIRSDDFYWLFMKDKPGWKDRQLARV